MSHKIENYCHRIGRTGRAGKEGLATTMLTDGDEEVMYDLREYLKNTEAAIPPGLQRHPSAQVPPGTLGKDGKPVGKRRDTVIFSNK